MSKEAILSVTLKKFGDKLIYEKGAEEILYKKFVEQLDEGHRVQIFFDADVDNGTYAQLSKIKVCIRTLSKYTGDTFEDMEKMIKRNSGLYNEVSGEYKSFGDCSSSDLGLAIQAIIEHGDFLGINCR